MKRFRNNSLLCLTFCLGLIYFKSYAKSFVELSTSEKTSFTQNQSNKNQQASLKEFSFVEENEEDADGENEQLKSNFSAVFFDLVIPNFLPTYTLIGLKTVCLESKALNSYFKRFIVFRNIRI